MAIRKYNIVDAMLVSQLRCVDAFLFSKRSQMMSKCGKNKKVTHKVQPSVSLMFLQYFDGFCTNPWQHGIYLFYMIMAMSSMCPSSNRSQVRTNKKDRIQLIMKEHPLPDLDMLDQYSNMVTILLLCSLKKKSNRKSIYVLKTKTWKYMWGEILNRDQDMRSGK